MLGQSGSFSVARRSSMLVRRSLFDTAPPPAATTAALDATGVNPAGVAIVAVPLEIVVVVVDVIVVPKDWVIVSEAVEVLVKVSVAV